MHPLIIHRVATTAMLPLVAAGGWAGYTNYSHTPTYVPQQALVCTALSLDVRPGSTAGEIASLQRFLSAEGYLYANATGYFGQATYTALTRFQADHGLPITGIADTQTRAAIQQVSCGGYAYTYPYQQPTYAYPQHTYQPPLYQQQHYHCSDYYDRTCYVNGRYVGPSFDGSSTYTYNGPGDTCDYLNGQWVGTCGGTTSYGGYDYSDPYQYGQYNQYNADQYAYEPTY